MPRTPSQAAKAVLLVLRVLVLGYCLLVWLWLSMYLLWLADGKGAAIVVEGKQLQQERQLQWDQMHLQLQLQQRAQRAHQQHHSPTAIARRETPAAQKDSGKGVERRKQKRGRQGYDHDGAWEVWHNEFGIDEDDDDEWWM
jgi:hypothetical protein